MKSHINIYLVSLILCFIFLSCNESIIEPEEQFVQIYFKYSFKNELNTFKNTFQKDLVLDGVIKVPFWLTADEQNKILDKANEYDFFSMPDTFDYSSLDTILLTIEPNPGKQILRIKFEGKDKITLWKYPIIENDSQLTNLFELRKFIISIIEAKPEYKTLPSARGGYL